MNTVTRCSHPGNHNGKGMIILRTSLAEPPSNNTTKTIMDEKPEPPNPLPVSYPSSSQLTSLSSRPPSTESCASPLFSESDGPNTDDDFETDSSPPRKRRKVCPSSAISSSVRATVIEKAGGKCWLCGLNGSHIAHVIARSETDLVFPPPLPPLRNAPDPLTDARLQFAEYKLSGLLHMDSLDELQNLMFLCAGCHHAFDARVPIWAFLPLDLDAFISRENAFHLARADAASLGLTLSRPDPRNSTLKALRYGRYQIRPNYLHDSDFLAQPVKHWFGNPIAAILRSAGVLAGVQRLDPLTRGGLPEDVAWKLHELLLLYGVPPPPVQGIARRLELGSQAERPGDAPASPELPHNDDTIRPPPTAVPPNTPRDTRGMGTTHRATGAKDVQHHMRVTAPRAIPVVRRKRCRHGGMTRWVFGPNMTSNMLIQWWSMDSLQLEMEDEAESGGIVEEE